MKRSHVFRWLLIGMFLVPTASLLRPASADAQVRRRPGPIRQLVERLRQRRAARTPEEQAEARAKADRAFNAMSVLVRQLIADQMLSDKEKATNERYLADPLAQQVFAILAAKKGQDFEFDEEAIGEVLRAARPELGVEDDQEWNGLVRGVITKLKEMPEFTGDRDVNQLLDVMFDAVSTTLGEGKELSKVQEVALGLTLRQFLQSKKTESLKLMEKSLKKAEQIRESGQDPQQALQELRGREKK